MKSAIAILFGVAATLALLAGLSRLGDWLDASDYGLARALGGVIIYPGLLLVIAVGILVVSKLLDRPHKS